MEILVLGGTAFLGQAVASEALTRGHSVTCAARGNGRVPDGAILVCCDRDQDAALESFSSRNWDAIIDVTCHPIHVRRAVLDLNAKHWVFVSTSSVYALTNVLEQNESAQLRSPLDGDFMAEPAQYPAAKAACEDIYRGNTDSLTIVRSGLIGGYGDSSGRTGYYTWRFAHPTSDDVLVPDPNFPVALIDVADLSSWLIDCAEQKHIGTFNATGSTTSLAEVLELSRQITRSTAVARVVEPEILSAFGVSSWAGPMSLPLWIDDPEWRYTATLDTSAAQAHGLRIRPLEETLRAALDYENHRPTPRLAGLSDDDERALRQYIAENQYRSEA
ncbi:NAD-dependent epimerase/dehydratase family protein [Populibacterium corticicola]|uniref:NAD-dependent epimerase/dehydratase family protein n=1 Tax=Populibacterium corticicola TaxID=1812826 RepID=UPI003671C332